MDAVMGEPFHQKGFRAVHDAGVPFPFQERLGPAIKEPKLGGGVIGGAHLVLIFHEREIGRQVHIDEGFQMEDVHGILKREG